MKAIRIFLHLFFTLIAFGTFAQSNENKVDSIAINPKNKVHDVPSNHSLIQNPQLQNLGNQNASYDYIGKTIYNREIQRRRIYSINELVK